MGKRFPAVIYFHLVAIIWFAFVGAIFAALLSLYVISSLGVTTSEIVRFIFIVSLFSAEGGLLLGASIPNKELVRTQFNAVARGIGIAVFTFPLSLYAMMEIPIAPQRAPSLSAQLYYFPIMLIGFTVLIGWLIVLAGATAGWLLFILTNETYKHPEQSQTGLCEMDAADKIK